MKQCSDRFRKIICYIIVNLSLFILNRCTASNSKNMYQHSCLDLLLVGRFQSKNWIRAHLLPMLDSGIFNSITIVSETQFDIDERLYWVMPSPLLSNVLGSTTARLAQFISLARGKKYNAVGGFHLLLNGIIAITAAQIYRKLAFYYCVGGPAEVLGGGINSENRLFDSRREYDIKLEKKLLRIAGRADVIVVMGNSARQFFIDESISAFILVNPGGIQTRGFGSLESTCIDVLYVGRLAPIKNLEALISAIGIVKEAYPDIKLVLVGDGHERFNLEAKVRELDLAQNVEFAGFQSDVDAWLFRARFLILTSISEGLSLSVMEAVVAGVPVLCPRVGDLSDAVSYPQTGKLFEDCSADGVANAIRDAIADPNLSRDVVVERGRDIRQMFTSEAAIKRWRSLQNCGLVID